VGEIQNNLIAQPVIQPTDFELETEIRHLLNADRGLAPDRLQLQVVDGHVILIGTVKTLADKQRAAQLAWSAEPKVVDTTPVQVRPAGPQLTQALPSAPPQFVGGSGPPYMVEKGAGRSRPTDQQLERQIKDTLCHDPQLCCNKIDVKVRNGQAIISGRVKNIDHRAAVFSDAWIAGVSRVDMSGLTLEQLPPAGFPPEALAFYPEWITPVEYNFPSLGAPPAWNDAAISEAVRFALLHNPRLEPYLINVAVEHGKVTLTGAVDNLRAKRLASDQAGQIRGVQEVVNRLLVHPNGKPADQEVTDQARAALQRDPVLAPGQWQVAVQQGRAVLSGTADSDFERARAEDVLAGLNGVLSVKNEIKVNPGS
jgi:osmotically-inducible protein OsmY